MKPYPLTDDEVHHMHCALESYQRDLEDARHCSRGRGVHLIAGYDRDIEEVAALRERFRSIRMEGGRDSR